MIAHQYFWWAIMIGKKTIVKMAQWHASGTQTKKDESRTD